MRPNRELATPTVVPPVVLRALTTAAEPYGPVEYAEPLAELPQPAATSTAAKGAAIAMNSLMLRFMGVPFSGSGHWLRVGGASARRPRVHFPVPLRDEHAVHEELDCTGGQAAGVDRVRSREGVDLEPVVCGLRVEDPDQGDKTLRRHFRRVPEDPDRVVVVGGVDDDAVGLAVTGGATERAGEVDVHVSDVGAAQVVHGDEVGAAESVEVDPLDAGGVHRDAGDVAGESEPVAVRRQLDLLGDVGAVE